MIVFDLKCAPGGHVFEAWFGSTDDYEAQRARGLVSCPLCGTADIDKAVMAPNVGMKGNRRATPSMPSDAAAPSGPAHPVAMPAAPAIGPDAMKAMLRALAEAQVRALKESDYVGNRFAEEARAIHLGESEQRAIHGQTTPDQAKALLEEGIEVMPLPFPVRPPGTDN